MAISKEAFKELVSSYHSLLAKPTLSMTAEEKQSHAELLLHLGRDVREYQANGLGTVNKLLESQAEKTLEISEKLAPTSDTAFSGLAEGLSKGATFIDSLLILMQ